MKAKRIELNFKRNAITELNRSELNQINGGTSGGLSPLLPSIIALTPIIISRN